MSWLIVAALFVYYCWRAKRSRDQIAEYRATGMIRSPLAWAQAGLAVVLLALIVTMGHFLHQSVAVYLLAAMGLTIIALIFVRRALKWRYPI